MLQLLLAVIQLVKPVYCNVIEPVSTLDSPKPGDAISELLDTGLTQLERIVKRWTQEGVEMLENNFSSTNPISLTNSQTVLSRKTRGIIKNIKIGLFVIATISIVLIVRNFIAKIVTVIPTSEIISSR